MKKLLNISNQIKNNTFSYTGKGAFESVVINHKLDIHEWLENLIPLQQQIEYLDEKSSLSFQKRNYTRILTKLFPNEYNEFVSINILVRDSNIIAKYYDEEFNLTILYTQLIENNYLKYPGNNQKFVEFEIFQKFIMMYRDELQEFVDTNETNVLSSNINKIEQIKEEKIEIEEENQKQKETNWTDLLLGGKST